MVDTHFLEIINVGLTSIALVFLIVALFIVNRYIPILKANKYQTKRWRAVQLLIVLFMLGFSSHLWFILFHEIPFIDPIFIVSFFYFLGGIFVLISLNSIYSTITMILGEQISDNNAIALFQDHFGEFNRDKLIKEFPLECEVCEDDFTYSIVDIVRSNVNSIDRGIIIQSTFGVRSFVLRPTHKCIDGRREITVIHDKNMEFRSTDQSRLLIAGGL